MSYRKPFRLLLWTMSFALAATYWSDQVAAQTTDNNKTTSAPTLPWITSIGQAVEADSVVVSTATGLPLRPSQVSLAKLASPQEFVKLGETETSAWKILLLDDRSRIFATDYSGNCYVGSISDASQWKKLDFKSRWSRAACNLEGQVVLGTEDGKIVSASTTDLAFSAPVDAHQGAIFSIRPSADRKTFLTASGDGSVKVWNSADRTMIRSIAVGSQAVWDAVYVLGNQMIVTGDADRRVNLYEAASGQLQMSLGIISDWATSIEVLPNDLVAVGSLNGKVYIFDCLTKTRVMELQGPGSGIWSLSLCSDGQHLVAGTRSHGLHVISSTDWATKAAEVRQMALSEQPPAPPAKATTAP